MPMTLPAAPRHALPRSTRARRGYMLIEAIVAGGVVAVALTALAAQFGIADATASASVRAVQASQALQDGIGRAFAVDFATLATFSTPVPPGVVSRSVTVTTMGAPPCMGCKRAIVVVTYKNANGQLLTLTETVYRTP